MSTNNQISIAVPQTVIDEVTTKLQECKTALAPYLQALTPDQRKTIFKMGDKTVAIVQKTKSYLSTNPEFAPAYMDQAEFAKDEQVVTALTPLANLAGQLSADIDDTIMLAGSEALVAALLYYGMVKEAAAKGVPTAKPLYDDLAQRFSRKNSNPAATKAEKPA